MQEHREKLALLKRSLQEDRPAAWEQIPDIELYMDQVVGYMPRQHTALAEGEPLTPAMINNYVKKGLLPRANGKRYDRTHLAYLTAICLFKQVLSVADTDALLKLQLESREIGSFYEDYCEKLDAALSAAANSLREGASREEIKDLLLDLTLSAYAQKTTCERLLRLLAQPQEPAEGGTAEKPERPDKTKKKAAGKKTKELGS